MCLHAGLIPIVSYEWGIDVDDFGVVLKENSINIIKTTVQMVSQFPAEQLRQMAQKAWEFAGAGHKREKFAEEFKKVILGILVAAVTPAHMLVDCGMRPIAEI